MGTEQKAEGNQPINAEESQGSNNGSPAIGFARKLETKYRELKENAEAYPYVWASYAVVYGGFGLWFLYRWKKLRNTEDRVRILQARLRELAMAEAKESSATVSSSTAATASENVSSAAASKNASSSAASKNASSSSASNNAFSSASEKASSSTTNVSKPPK